MSENGVWIELENKVIWIKNKKLYENSFVWFESRELSFESHDSSNRIWWFKSKCQRKLGDFQFNVIQIKRSCESNQSIVILIMKSMIRIMKIGNALWAPCMSDLSHVNSLIWNTLPQSHICNILNNFCDSTIVMTWKILTLYEKLWFMHTNNGFKNQPKNAQLMRILNR